MEPWLPSFVAAVEQSGFTAWATGSGLVYPIANTAHVVGAIMLVGSISVLDLRLLGYARAIPAAALRQALLPISFAGFAILVGSGVVLFVSDARALAASEVFRVKLLLILLAGLNAAAFRLMDKPGQAPVRTRVLAGASLLLWLTIVVAGRWIAYV